MKQITFVLLMALWLATGCSDSRLESSRQFTQEFADALKKADGKLKVEVTGDLEVKVTGEDGRESTAYLNNAYDLYKQNPQTKADVIQHYVASDLESIQEKEKKLDRADIVPVIKDRSWLKEVNESMEGEKAKKAQQLVTDEFTPDLVVVYGADTAKGIRFLMTDDLKTMGVERTDLRQLACDNLKRLVPKIEKHGTNGTYMITADGTYEASLLLFDSFWKRIGGEVKGDVVAAVPTRDLLLVTGSQDADGIKQVRRLVKEASSKSSYKISPTLLVYRNGKFEEFRGPD